MGRHGEYIRKRIDGRWEGRYGIYNEEKGAKAYHSVYGKSYDEVKRKLTEVKDRLEKPVETIPSCSKNICFSEAAEEWFADIRENRKNSTYVKYRVVYNTHIKEQFQHVKLADVTEQLISEQLSEINNFSASLQKSIYCVLKQILKSASQKYLIVLPDVKQIVPAKKKKPIEVFTKAELSKLLSVLYYQTDRFKIAVLLCLSTGIRLGELCSLKWEDIDTENKLLAINRTVQRVSVEGRECKTALMETKPKSEHSRREIPLQGHMLDLLLCFKNGQEAYIFGGNKPLEPRTMQNHFKKILDEAGIAHKNFHTLRHTYATNCIEGGADVKSLSEMLGHSDVQITMNKYVHPSMDTKRKYADRLYCFYGQICGHAS